LDFGKWLKGHLRHRIFVVTGRHKEEIECIDRVDLGEWAVSQIGGGYFPYESLDWELKHIVPHHKDKLLLQMAIACLGEVEVKRRLKGVKK